MSNGLAVTTGFLPLQVDPGIGPDKAAPSVQPHYRAFISTTTDCFAPVPRLGTLVLVGAAHLDFSLRIGVPKFRPRAWTEVTPPPCRMPPSQKSGHPPGLSQSNETPPVLTSSIRFRHVISGSLSLVFSVPT